MTATSSSPTPREVLQELLLRVEHGRWAELSSLYATDVVVEHPLARDEPRVLTGRAAVAAMFDGYAQSGVRLVPRNLVFYDVMDPDLVVADFVYDAAMGDTRFEVSACFLWRVRSGFIVHARDYMGPMPG